MLQEGGSSELKIKLIRVARGSQKVEEDFVESVAVSRQKLAAYARERSRKTKTRCEITISQLTS